MAHASRVDDAVVTEPEFGPLMAKASILIVDDEPGMRNFLMRTLTPRCGRVDEAKDVRQASGMLDAHV